MTISRKRHAPLADRYDWTLIRDAALQFPAEWMHEDEPPGATAYQIRRGTPRVFGPTAAFDAIVRKRDGVYVRFVGVPVTPIDPWDLTGPDFEQSLLRTFDPDLFPAGTPDLFYAFAEHDTPKHLKRLGAHTLPELDRHLAERAAKKAGATDTEESAS